MPFTLAHTSPLSVTHSPSHASLLHSLSLSFSRLRHTASVTPSPPSNARVSRPSHSRASPPSHLSRSRLSHSHGSLTHPLHCQSVSTLQHRLHPSVSSLRYDFGIVWFFHVGLWFLFQSYDWFDCFVCYAAWFPRKCEKILFGILCWDWCLFL